MTQQENKPVISKKHQVHLGREEKQKRMLLTGLIITLVIIFGLIGYGILDQTVLQGMKPIVSVGEENISVNYFQKIVWFERYILIQRHKELGAQYEMNYDNQFWAYFISNQLQNYENQLSPSYADRIGQSTLNQMVEDTLIKQEAKRRNITVSDDEINKYIQSNIFGYYADGTPTTAPSPTPFVTSTLSGLQMTLVPYTATATMTATSTGNAPTATATATEAPTATLASGVTPTVTPTEAPMATLTPFTLDAYNQLISQYISAGYQHGLTMDDIKTFMSGYIYRDKLTEQLSTGISSEQEQVWARHILVADEEAANKVLDRLNKGEDFGALAKELSTDSGSKDKGGDVGWFGRGAMVKAFEENAFSMKIGETSKPVKTDYGYHIIQVLGHENRSLTVAEIEKLKTQELTNWLNSQYTSVKITYADNLLSYIPQEPTLAIDEYFFPTMTPSGY